MAEPTTTFEREVVFDAAFDKRHTDPSRNYGIHGAEIRFYLRGPKGVMQFVVFTGWQLPHVAKEQERNRRKEFMEYVNGKPIRADLFRGTLSGDVILDSFNEVMRTEKTLSTPMGADVGYHSPVPLYEGQTALTEECPIIFGRCFYDGSGCQGQNMLALLIAEGSEAVWRSLEESYHYQFDDAPPAITDATNFEAN